MAKFIYMLKIHLNQSTNYLSKGEKKIGIKKLKHPKAFTDYSQTIDNVYENFEDSNSIKKSSVDSH